MTPSWIIVHHTASARDTTTFAAVNEYHRTKNWGTATAPAYASKSALGYYISYHYFITADGVVTKGANDNEIRWHAGAMNDKALGVCLAGWFDTDHDAAPTAAQVSSLTTILKQLSQTHGIAADHIVPHRKFAQKTCYGMKLADEWAAKLIAVPAPNPGQPIGAPFPVYKKVGQGTLYARIGNVLTRISTDWNTYVGNYGSAVPIIELSDVDFAMFTIATTLSVK